MGLDIATCRWNLTDWAGIDAGDAFVASYEQLTGERHHPYWDIAGILEDDWDDIDEPDRIAQAEQFLAWALSRWDGYARRATRIRPLGRAGL